MHPYLQHHTRTEIRTTTIKINALTSLINLRIIHTPHKPQQPAMYAWALNPVFLLPAEGGGTEGRGKWVMRRLCVVHGLRGLERAEERWGRSGVWVVVV